jgi:hypothetical protein
VEAERKAQQEKLFALDVDQIASGEDKRTTLMIKNIPNKYTQKMLLQVGVGRTPCAGMSRICRFTCGLLSVCLGNHRSAEPQQCAGRLAQQGGVC